ncbi:MAG: hypothetical protein ABSG32_08840 [Terriglobia bacterium]|jgi:hypothetical protein
MRRLLISASKDAVDKIKRDKARLECWNESVFRLMYSQSVAKRDPNITHFCECSRIDLVLHRGSQRAFVEFKFYIHRIKYDPFSREKRGIKGGPGKKNFGEFKRCVQTLKRREAPGAVKLVALFYSDPAGSTAKRRYDDDYGDHRKLQNKLNIPLRLRAKLGSFLSNGSDCNARLYEVA